MIFEDFEDKADSLTELKNELMTKVFVEQPPTLGLLNTLDSASRMQKKNTKISYNVCQMLGPKRTLTRNFI